MRTNNIVKYHAIKHLITGEYIYLHTQNLGITQKDLADMLGINKTALNDIIHNRISLSTGRKLSIFYVLKDLYKNLK